ncbi:LCP family protein [Bhargavaea ullalensis]|uniref:LCP family protein required for cell wall assembly n=1 Tax=Bhargavaea ullalensis TaxID=1265685 RepID=A0ABV2GET5_9BACL
MKRTDYRKKRQTAKRKTVLKVSMILSLSIVLFVAAYGVFLMKKAEQAADGAFESVDREKSDLRAEKVKPLTHDVSVLFIGVDGTETRGESMEKSRSDALVLATLNKDDKTVKLVSIPRDSLVYIDKVGYKDKITHAHAFDGTRGSIDAVEELLDIPVDYYVEMNFHAFIDVVDALGGIEAEVPYERLEKDEFDNYTIQLEPGFQKLDGQHALALARTRKLDSDVERGKRQQMIMEAIVDKATNVTSISKYADVIDALGKNMKTNMTFEDMKSFLGYVKDGKPKMDMLNLEGKDDMSTGIYYWILDEQNLQDVQDILKSHLGLKPDTSNMSDASGAGTSNHEYATDSPSQ